MGTLTEDVIRLVRLELERLGEPADDYSEDVIRRGFRLASGARLIHQAGVARASALVALRLARHETHCLCRFEHAS